MVRRRRRAEQQLHDEPAVWASDRFRRELIARMTGFARRRLLDRELRDRAVAQNEYKVQFNWTSGKLPGNASGDDGLTIRFGGRKHGQLRLILFTRIRDPGLDRFSPNVLMSLVTDGRIDREAS